MRRLAVIVLTAGALADAASAGKLTDGSRKEILRLLDVVADGDEVGDTRYGELAQGQVIELPFEGDHTLAYYVNAICDDDCVNIDLAIKDASGVEIDVDDADDNAPILYVQADAYNSAPDKADGAPRPMSIEVRMKACKAETCAYGLRITENE